MQSLPPSVSGVSPSAALRVFKQIAEAWKLRPEEHHQLLGIATQSNLDEEPGPATDPVVLYRIGCLVSIYRSLHTLFRDPLQADAWVHRANAGASFGGRAAIELLTSADLSQVETVRDHLLQQFD